MTGELKPMREQLAEYIAHGLDNHEIETYLRDRPGYMYDLIQISRDCIEGKCQPEENGPPPVQRKHWDPDDHWDEHPDWPREDWGRECAENETTLGYVDWVNNQIELNDEED